MSGFVQRYSKELNLTENWKVQDQLVKFMHYKNFDTDNDIQGIALETLKNLRTNCNLLFFYKLFNGMIDAPNIIIEFKFRIPATTLIRSLKI